MCKKLTIAILFIYIFTFLLQATAVASSTSKHQKASVYSRISKIQDEKASALKAKAKLESDKENLATTQTTASKEYNQLLSQANETQATLDELNRSVADAEAEYNQKRETFQNRIRAAYEETSISILNMILDSQSLEDFLERLEYVSLISKSDKEIIDDLNQSKLDLEYKKQLQESTKQDLLNKVNDKKDRLTTLNISRAELESRLSETQAELDKLNKEEDQLLAESNKLQGVIKGLSKNRRYAGGEMRWPVPSSHSIASYFGMRKHPILRTYKMHTGIDISASKGTSILAANSGTVIIAKYDGNGYGNYVVIDHGGGISTLYGHASKLLVGVGDKVKAGQVIAKVGMTGLATGPHCHFEVRVDGIPENPFDYVN